MSSHLNRIGGGGGEINHERKKGQGPQTSRRLPLVWGGAAEKMKIPDLPIKDHKFNKKCSQMIWQIDF